MLLSRSNEPATMLPVRLTLSPVRSTSCIVMNMCWSSDVISVKWQTIKTNNPKSVTKNEHLSILTRTSNDAEKYAVGICGSGPKQRSGTSLIFMKLRLCRWSYVAGPLIFEGWLTDFCCMNVESRFDIQLCCQCAPGFRVACKKRRRRRLPTQAHDN